MIFLDQLSFSVPRTFLLKSTSPEPKSYESYDQKSPLNVTKITSKRAQNNGKNTSFYKKFQASWKLGTFLGKIVHFWDKIREISQFLGKISKITDFWAFVTYYECWNVGWLLEVSRSWILADPETGFLWKNA